MSNIHNFSFNTFIYPFYNSPPKKLCNIYSIRIKLKQKAIIINNILLLSYNDILSGPFDSFTALEIGFLEH